MAEQMMQETAGKAIPAGYKQTEVGVIPEDWDVYLLKNICSSFKTGKLDANAMILDGEYRFYTCARNYYWINQYAFDDEALLISGNGANVGYIHYYKGKFNAYQRTYVLTCFSADIQFLKKQMEVNLSERIRTEVNAGNTPYITMDTLTDMMVPLPKNRQEQTAIANVLSDSDALIDALEQLIAKKQAIKSATMQQLLTGRTRLPAFALRPDGTKKGYKPSELGEIPEDWEVCEMGSLGFTYGGLTGKSKKDFGHGNGLYVPFTNVMANIIVDIAKLEKVHVAENQNDVINGDLLFNGSSETPEEVCFCSLVNNDVSGLYLNSFCFGFRRKDGAQYIPIYLSYWFRSSIGRKAVSIMAQGSTRYNISKKQFLKLSITLPSIEEQTAIATILSDMDNELQALTQKLEKAHALKQGMMQQLLTGKIRLPLAAGA